MENIFKNAQFGKAYKTMDGRKAVYLWSNKKDGHSLIVDGEKKPYHYNDGGKFYSLDTEDVSDIVSEWQEEINEKELAEDTSYETCEYDDASLRQPYCLGYRLGFRDGYRNAKEEQI